MKTKLFILGIFIGALFGFSNAVLASTLIDPVFDSLPEEWGVSAAKGTVSASGGVLHMEYDTTGAAASGKAEVITPDFRLDDGIIIVEFSGKINGASNKSLRTLLLKDDNALNLVKLFEINNRSVSVFNSSVEVPADDDVAGRYIFAIDTKNSAGVRGVAWINNEKVFDGIVSDWPVRMNTSKLALRFRNRLSASQKLKAEWDVSALKVKQSSGMVIKTIPEDSSFSKADDISISFNDAQSPLMLEKESYSISQEGEDIDFSIFPSADGIKLVPADPFETNSKYTLRIKKPADIFGTYGEEKTVEFTSIPKDYELPVITFDTEQMKNQIKCGEVLPIYGIASIEHPAKAELYVNDVLQQTADSVSGLRFVSENSGEFWLKLKVYDAFGAFGVSESYAVTVSENDIPKVTIAGIADNQELSAEALRQIGISAADSDRIEKVNVYLDDQLISVWDEASFVLNLSEAGIGSHTLTVVVYDEYGACGRQSVSFKLIVTYMKDVLFEKDFNVWASATKLKSGILLYNQRGYYDFGQIDPEHGNSLLLGIETADESFTEINRAYANIEVGGVTQKLYFDCDFYIDNIPSKQFSITLKKSGSTSVSMLNVTDVMTAGGKTMEYELHKWYKLSSVIDIKNSRCSVFIDGIPFAADFALDKALDCLDYVRIWGPEFDDVKTWWAIDNISAKTEYKAPEIAGFAGEDMAISQAVDFQSKKIYAMLSGGGFEGTSINTQSVYLLDDNNKKIPLAAVGYEKTENRIVLLLNNALKPDTKYSFVLAKDVLLAGGIPLGSKIAGTFRTSMGAFGVQDVLFADGGACSFTANLINNSGEEQTVYIVTAIYRNNVQISVNAVKEIVAADSNREIKAEVGQMKEGDTAEVYIWDRLYDPRLLSGKIYRYEK